MGPCRGSREARRQADDERGGGSEREPTLKTTDETNTPHPMARYQSQRSRCANRAQAPKEKFRGRIPHEAGDSVRVRRSREQATSRQR